MVISVLSLAPLCGPAFALTFGEMVVRSHLGEGFAGKVDFILAPGEVADESCFTLAQSPATDGLASLPTARLMVTPSAHGGTLQIRSAQPVNEPIVRVVLQASCPTLGQLQREYTVLLDPPTLSPPGIPLATDESEASQAAVPTPPAGTRPSSSTTKRRSARPRMAARSDRPASKAPATAVAKAGGESGFRLKLSSGEIDLSRSETMTERERAELREKQLLMDADDQVANLLALKNSVKELQARLAELQLKMTPLAAAPVAADPAASVATQSTTPPPAGKPTVGTRPPSAKPAPRESAFDWTQSPWYWWTLPVLVLALGLFVWRRKRAATASTSPDQMGGEAPQPSEEGAKRQAEDLVDLDFHAELRPADAQAAETETPTADPRDLYRNVILSQFPELKLTGRTDPLTVIDVAWKYFEDKGECGRAIELVEFGLEEHPDAEDLWLTQFEFHRRDGRRSAYEQLAKRYRQRFPSGMSWGKIQAGGRFLDPDNPLYVETAAPAPSAGLVGIDFDITGENNGAGDNPPESGKKATRAATASPDLSIPLDFTPTLDSGKSK